MNLIIKKTIMPGEYKELLKDSNWPLIRDFEIKELLVNSKYKIAIYDDSKLVGMARCITDNIKIFFLCDVIVKKEYQGKKIGSLLVNSLIDIIKDDNKNNSELNIYIMSIKGKEGFYEKLGFKKDIKTGLTYYRGN